MLKRAQFSGSVSKNQCKTFVTVKNNYSKEKYFAVLVVQSENKLMRWV